MRNLSPVLLIALALSTMAPAPLTPETDQGGWISLFNGKNLDGWTPKVAGYAPGVNAGNVFRAEDGVLKIAYDQYGNQFANQFGHIFYRDTFSYFILRMQYRFVGEMLPDAPGYCYRNSGVMFHSEGPDDMALDQYWPVSLETQLLSSTDSVQQTTANMCTPGTTVHLNGKFTDEHCIASDSGHFPDSVWIDLEIVVQGSGATHHIINGDTVLSFTKPQLGGYLLPADYPMPPGTVLRSGYIALQAEGQPIEFRKIRLKKLRPGRF
ncbi:MAG: DUF1080 domain-containing protein [Bacteroidia bacterium]|nr:DUF1080 domain-containing protein [Bacteroidia bacterium]